MEETECSVSLSFLVTAVYKYLIQTLADHKMKERHWDTSNIFAAALTPSGVGSVKACVSNRETVKRAWSSLSVNNTSKPSPL